MSTTQFMIHKVRVLQNPYKGKVNYSLALCAKENNTAKKAHFFLFEMQHLEADAPADAKPVVIPSYAGSDSNCKQGLIFKSQTWKKLESQTNYYDIDDEDFKLTEKEKELAKKLIEKGAEEIKKKIIEEIATKAGVRHVFLAGHLILATSHAGVVTAVVTGPLHVVWGVIHGIYEIYDAVKIGVRAFFGKDISLEEAVKKKIEAKFAKGIQTQVKTSITKQAKGKWPKFDKLLTAFNAYTCPTGATNCSETFAKGFFNACATVADVLTETAVACTNACCRYSAKLKK